jgi:uncharacterized protein (TIGR03437 family)
MGELRKWQNLTILFGLILAGTTTCLAATPKPVIQNVTDAAGFGPRVAPGSLASIFGTNLASGENSATDVPLPTSLGGASVVIGSVSAPLLYVNAGQINFQVPSSLKSGVVSLVVNGPGGASASFSFTVTSSAPAIFQYGTNRAVAQNADGTLNSSSALAAAGSVVTVYLTGIGPVDNTVTDGSATPSSPLSTATAANSATIGTMSAPVQFLGLAPTFVGLAQANIQVPSLPNGDYPLVITVGGYLSASAVISVSGPGTAYTSPLTLSGSAAFANSPNSSIALYNNVAYVCGTNRITMVNVTNPAQPTVIGEFGDSVLNGYGNRCAINLTVTTPYLVEIIGNPAVPESFAVYGLSNPQAPNLLDIATTTQCAQCIQMVSMSFSGNTAFITTSYITYYTSNRGVASQNGDLLVFDFTNPAAPVYLGIMQPSGQPGSGDQNLKPYGAVVDQIYEYIASSTATGSSNVGNGFLDIVSVSSPSTPNAINTVTVGQAAILMSFDISGNTLLAAGNTAGQRNPGNPDFDFLGNLTLTTMDISNVQAPVVIATFTSSLQVNGTYNVFGFSNGVFAIVNNPPDVDDFGPATLMIVDARQPASMLLYPFQTQFGFAGILTTNNGYLLAPTSLGLNIYQLQLQ